MYYIISRLAIIVSTLLNIFGDSKYRKYFLMFSIFSSLIFCIAVSMHIYNAYSSQFISASGIGDSVIVGEKVVPDSSIVTNDTKNSIVIGFSTMVLMILSLFLFHVVYTVWIIIGFYFQPQNSKSRGEQIQSV